MVQSHHWKSWGYSDTKKMANYTQILTENKKIKIQNFNDSKSIQDFSIISSNKFVMIGAK